VTVYKVPDPYPPDREEHPYDRTVGIGLMALSGVFLTYWLGLLCLVGAVIQIVPTSGPDSVPVSEKHQVSEMLGLFMLETAAKVAANVIAAWGIMKSRRWAFWLVIIADAIVLIRNGVPRGSVLTEDFVIATLIAYAVARLAGHIPPNPVQ
jgi:hypothetical protein